MKKAEYAVEENRKDKMRLRREGLLGFFSASGLNLLGFTIRCKIDTTLHSSMTTLMEHSGAQPRECSFMPKKLMSTNNFLIGLVLGCVRYDKNRAHF